MLFSYTAKAAEGKETKGEREAESRAALARALREEGLFVITIEESQGARSLSGFLEKVKSLNPFSRVPLSEKILFSKNLGVMIGAGLPLTRALDALRQETSNAIFKAAIGDIIERTKRGSPLSEGLKGHPKIFSELFSAMVAAGEKSGKLEESLRILTGQMQNDYELRRRVRGALIYPAVVITAMIGVGIVMFVTIVPMLQSTFEEFNLTLPLSTRAIIGISDFFLSYGIWAAGVFIVIVIAFFQLAKKPVIHRALQRLMLRMPLFGSLIKQVNVARTARTLASLLLAGIQTLEALTVTARVLTFVAYREALERAHEEIQKGKTISSILRANPALFPNLLDEMIAVGEETGNLSDMLEEAAQFYEAEVANTTKNLSTIMEPLLMIVIGGAVGFFAVAMITPLYSMLGNI
jgi:type IV pilus assembly protein PilC